MESVSGFELNQLMYLAQILIKGNKHGPFNSLQFSVSIDNTVGFDRALTFDPVVD